MEAKSVVPFHYLQVILNGRVVASREDTGGTRELTIKEKVYVAGPRLARRPLLFATEK